MANGRLLGTLLFGTGMLLAQSPDSCSATLQKADQFYGFYNFVAAAPLYQQAEQICKAEHNIHSSAYAQVGYLRATMESRSLPQLSRDLAHIAQSALAHDDLPLALKCWAAKANG
jgi:hypothetical protein